MTNIMDVCSLEGSGLKIVECCSVGNEYSRPNARPRRVEGSLGGEHKSTPSYFYSWPSGFPSLDRQHESQEQGGRPSCRTTAALQFGC